MGVRPAVVALDVLRVDLQALGGVVQRRAEALRANIRDAPVAIVSRNGGVLLYGLRVQLDGLLVILVCKNKIRSLHSLLPKTA